MTHVTDVTISLIDLAALAGDDVLAGVSEGVALLPPLIERCDGLPPGAVVLDCRGLVVYTASHFRESALGLREYCRRTGADLYPVLGNVNRKTEEELTLFLRQAGEVFVVCEADARAGVSRPRVLGVLEDKQRLTFDAVARLGRADAAGLRAAHPDEGIGLTGWSNRLAALAARGLLRESRHGRGKVYEPILEGLTLGR